MSASFGRRELGLVQKRTFGDFSAFQPNLQAHDVKSRKVVARETLAQVRAIDWCKACVGMEPCDHVGHGAKCRHASVHGMLLLYYVFRRYVLATVAHPQSW